MPAHRRPPAPPSRPALGVLAAILVGGTGLGVALTGPSRPVDGPDPGPDPAGVPPA